MTVEEKKKILQAYGITTYDELIELGIIVYRICYILGILEVAKLPPDQQKGKMGKVVLKNLTEFIIPSPFKKKDSMEDTFAFLEDLIPLFDKHAENIKHTLDTGEIRYPAFLFDNWEGVNSEDINQLAGNKKLKS